MFEYPSLGKYKMEERWREFHTTTTAFVRNNSTCTYKKKITQHENLLCTIVYWLAVAIRAQPDFCDGHANCEFLYNVVIHQPMLRRWVNPTSLNHFEYM